MSPLDWKIAVTAGVLLAFAASQLSLAQDSGEDSGASVRLGSYSGSSVHDVGITCQLQGPAHVNSSDAGGAHMYLTCAIVNFSDHDDAVVITDPADLISWAEPTGCTTTTVLLIPGRTEFVLTASEHKTVLYRTWIVCHSPATPAVVALVLEATVTHREGCVTGDSNPQNDAAVISDNIGIGPPAMETGNTVAGSAASRRLIAASTDECPTPISTPPPAAADGDGDGFPDDVETQFIGTSAEDPCGTGGWPADIVAGTLLDSTNRVNLPDLMSYILPVRRINSGPGDPGFDSRWDIVPGPEGPFSSHINVADLQKLAFVQPPMLGGGIRAFNGPECPWPP